MFRDYINEFNLIFVTTYTTHYTKNMPGYLYIRKLEVEKRDVRLHIPKFLSNLLFYSWYILNFGNFHR